MKAATFGFLVGLVVAGCVSPTPVPDGPIESESSTSQETHPDADGQSVETMEFRMAANECSGFYTLVVWPGMTGPGSAPPGWEPPPLGGDPFLGSTSAILVLDCTRVAWGPFERPAKLLFDFHSKAIAPGPCESPGARHGVLHGLWTDDLELASFLAAAYRMPVHAGTFTAARSGTSPVELTWTWNEPDAAESTLTARSLDTGGFETTWDERLAWDNGDGVSILALTATSIASTQTPNTFGQSQPVHGTLRPPMLHAERSTTYASNGHLIRSSEWSGEVVEFEDTACERPSSQQ